MPSQTHLSTSNPKFATVYAELERLENFLMVARKLLPIKWCESLESQDNENQQEVV